MFAFRNMYPGKRSILGSALVYPVSTWIHLSRSIQQIYIQWGKFTEPAFQPGIPGGTNLFPNAGKQTSWRRPTGYVGSFLLDRWIHLEHEQTRADLKMDGFSENMLWKVSMKDQPHMSRRHASHAPHSDLHALPWLGFGLGCEYAWGISLNELIQAWWTSMWG